MLSCCGSRASRVAALISCAALLAAPAAAQEGAPADEPSAEAAAPAEPSEETPPAASAETGEATDEGEGEEAGPLAVPVSPFEEGAAKAFDVFPIRFLSAGATVVGFGAFVVSVPLVGPFGRLEAIRNSWEYFVLGPVDYTFVRPLGEF